MQQSSSLTGAFTVAIFILQLSHTPCHSAEPLSVDPLQLLTLLSRHDFIKGWDRSGIWQKRRPGSEFVGKRIPGSEFLGKRAPGSEFVGKREDPEEDLDEGVKIFKRSPELASPLMQSDRENHLSKSAVAAILAQEALEELDQNWRDQTLPPPPRTLSQSTIICNKDLVGWIELMRRKLVSIKVIFPNMSHWLSICIWKYLLVLGFSFWNYILSNSSYFSLKAYIFLFSNTHSLSISYTQFSYATRYKNDLLSTKVF